MSREVHELLLLGLLADGDAHGYELHEFLAQKLHFLTDLTRTTAYRLLDRMHREGLLSRETEREGRRPERMRYAVSEQGHARLDALLRAQLSSIDVLKPASNVALLFSQRLPAAECAAHLKKRLDELLARADKLDLMLAELPADSAAGIVLDRNLALIRADAAWLEKRVAHLAKQAPAPTEPE